MKSEDKTVLVTELGAAGDLGHELEMLVVQGKEFPDDERNILLMGYWSLLFDYHKGTLHLIQAGYHGAAFALVRSVVEALVRAHVALSGSDDTLKAIRDDTYRVNFATIGAEIDAAFGLGGLFENLLQSRDALHSYTHAGVFQLSRRYDGEELAARYELGAILEVIRSTTSAVFMVTCLVTKHLKREEAWTKAHELYEAWGKTH